jgi:hypothetical protein
VSISTGSFAHSLHFYRRLYSRNLCVKARNFRRQVSHMPCSFAERTAEHDVFGALTIDMSTWVMGSAPSFSSRC